MTDQNGQTVSKDIRKEGTVWGRNVWWGSGCVTNVTRQYYRTRQEARDGNISEPGTASHYPGTEEDSRGRRTNIAQRRQHG